MPVAAALAVAVAGAVLAVAGFLVTTVETWSSRTMRVGGASMEPTYPKGGDVTVRSVDGSRIRRGEVIVFSAHDWGVDSVYMKRVIGVGGDHVVITQAGTVRVDGAALSEPYLWKDDVSLGLTVDITVPAGRLFLLGDHRADSLDSRFHLSEHNGTIARSAVLGLVVDHPSDSSPDRSWTWWGLAVAAAGLIAAAVAATVRHRRIAAALGPPPGPARQHPDTLGRP